MSDGEVRELFSSCGRITGVALDRGGYSGGNSPKSGTITFDSLGSAEVAVKTMNGTKLRSSALSVSLA